MNGCCLLSLVCSSFVTFICHFRLPTMLVTTFEAQILRKNPGCLFRGQSCCVLIENDLLHCWIVCEPELMQSDTSEQAVGGYWSRDVADLSSERISSKDNKTTKVLQRATPGEVVGRSLTLCDSCCVARCGSARLGCHFPHTGAHTRSSPPAQHSEDLL